MTRAARLKAIGERVERATAGPWEERPDEVYLVRRPGREAITIQRFEFSNGDFDRAPEQQLADAAFIANARADVPWLLAELEAAEARIAALVEKSWKGGGTLVEFCSFCGMGPRPGALGYAGISHRDECIVPTYLEDSDDA